MRTARRALAWVSARISSNDCLVRRMRTAIFSLLASVSILSPLILFVGNHADLSISFDAGVTDLPEIIELRDQSDVLDQIALGEIVSSHDLVIEFAVADHFFRTAFDQLGKA